MRNHLELYTLYLSTSRARHMLLPCFAKGRKLSCTRCLTIARLQLVKDLTCFPPVYRHDVSLIWVMTRVFGRVFHHCQILVYSLYLASRSLVSPEHAGEHGMTKSGS